MSDSWIVDIPYAYQVKDVMLEGSRKRGDGWIHRSIPVRFVATDPENLPLALVAEDPRGMRVQYRSDGQYLYAPVAHPSLDKAVMEAGYPSPPEGSTAFSNTVDADLVRLSGIQDWTGRKRAEAAAARAERNGSPWQPRDGEDDQVARAEAESRIREVAASLVLVDDMLWQKVKAPEWLVSPLPEDKAQHVAFLMLPPIGDAVGETSQRFCRWEDQPVIAEDGATAIAMARALSRDGQERETHGSLEFHAGYPMPTPSQGTDYAASLAGIMVHVAEEMLRPSSNVMTTVGGMTRENMMLWADLRDRFGEITDALGDDIRSWHPIGRDDANLSRVRDLLLRDPDAFAVFSETVTRFVGSASRGLDPWESSARQMDKALQAAVMARSAMSFLPGWESPALRDGPSTKIP